MKHGVLFLLLDAFRADYLGRTTFLNKLSKQSGLGTLEEPFGFIPRPAYFGGLDVDGLGYSNMFCFDPANSPFGMARFLPKPEFLNERNSRKGIMEAAQGELSDFEKAYASSLSIPLEHLPYFDFSEKYPPWSKACGYRSLFHILDSKRQAWYQCSWPYTQQAASKSDGWITGQAIDHIKAHHSFSFVHLSELDTIGHQYGPGSKELQQTLEETDRLCEALFEHMESTYESFSLIAFGDHGMLKVLGTHNIQESMKALNLEFGQDFAYFIDSTLVRFWFFCEEAKQAVFRHLNNVDYGHFLSEEELGRYYLKDANPQNAHAYFLARPGLVFYPNFFQKEGPPPKGMHGYAPEVEDNKGLLLLYQSQHCKALELGNVQAKQLFPLTLHECKINPHEYTQVALPQLNQIRQNYPWTKATSKIANTEIEKQIEALTKRIKAVAPHHEAITIAGSFGRGEGAVRMQKEKVTAINDYDFVIYGNNLPSKELQSLSHALAKDFHTDFVDIGILPENLKDVPCSQYLYDYKYGSKVLSGNPKISHKIPNYAPEEIPTEDAILLLFNRVCGFLSHPIDCLWNDGPLSSYMVNQVVKVLISIGDAYLILWEDYSCSYQVRSKRFQELAHIEQLRPKEINIILSAYKYKIHPNCADLFKQPSIIKTAQSLMQNILRRILQSLKEAIPQKFNQVITACSKHIPTRHMRPLNQCLQQLSQQKLSICNKITSTAIDIRLNIYAANMMTFFALQHTSSNEEMLKHSIRNLRNAGFKIDSKELTEDPSKSWEKTRTIASASWNAITH